MLQFFRSSFYKISINNFSETIKNSQLKQFLMGKEEILNADSLTELFFMPKIM